MEGKKRVMIKGTSLPKSEQELIKCICLTYKAQTRKIQKEIMALCLESVDGDEEDASALFEMLTRWDISVDRVAREHYVHTSKLYRWRKRFYEAARGRLYGETRHK